MSSKVNSVLFQRVLLVPENGTGEKSFINKVLMRSLSFVPFVPVE